MTFDTRPNLTPVMRHCYGPTRVQMLALPAATGVSLTVSLGARQAYSLRRPIRLLAASSECLWAIDYASRIALEQVIPQAWRPDVS